MTDNQIQQSIEIARKNWKDWCDVFEHNGPLCDNPLLAGQDRFAAFLSDYSVSRTIRGGTHEKFRRNLATSRKFVEAINDDTGHDLDKLEKDLRGKFGTQDGRNRIISTLSKMAAFIRPDRFVAWDRYAKRGVNIALGRTASAPFDAYADYLAMFDKVWHGPPGQAIRNYVTRNGVQSVVESQPRFLRRVLDVYLMKCGGRWQ